MGTRWLMALSLALPLQVLAEEGVSLPRPADAASPLPWPDMAGRPVLHVERITDLKALLTVQSLLKARGEGYSVRLLGVSGSEAWFVADSLPVGGWRAMLVTEPHLQLQDGGPEAEGEPLPLLVTAIWDASAAVPDGATTRSPEVQLP